MLATGRGYAQHLATITAVVEQSNGNLEVIATGTFGKSQHGPWRLLLDPKVNHLVRSAEFKRSDGTVVLQSNSEDVAQNELRVVGKRGSLEFVLGSKRSFRIDVEVSAIDEASQDFIAEVTAQANAAPSPGAAITDFCQE
jgi:hypothetical protein